MKRRETYQVPISDPYINDEDVNAVAQAVREKKLSQGEYVERFEKEFAKYIGAKHAVAVSSGTTALHVALAVIGVCFGDEVMVPSFSFVATANCALFTGAKPVFVDIDPLTYNISPDEIKEKITDKARAIIPVHFAGQSADVDPINEIADRNGLYVIEDAAEAHGTLYKGKMVGSLCHLACFSFYPNKNMTTGEGGMITTNDDELAEKMRLMRSHGQDQRYHHIFLGYNFRMTDIQAALGLVQLKRLNWIIEKKVKAAEYYTKRLAESANNKVMPPYVASYTTHTYMLYPIRFQSKGKRDLAMARLEEAGVETRVTFPPIHLQPLYRKLFGYTEGFLPITERVAERILSIPIYPHITREEQDYVLSILEEA